MSYATSSIIPFDTGRSYVVRSLPLEPTDYRFEDKMGRTLEDRTFLEQFESIFLAASKGDLSTCQSVVHQGFCDFHAYSVGRYGTQQKRLDHVSPLQLAQDSEHTHIVAYFKKVMAEKNAAHLSKPAVYSDSYFGELDAAIEGLGAMFRPQTAKNTTKGADTQPTLPSLEHAASKTHIVLQGEFGIANEVVPFLKTTCPTTCTAIAFYNQQRRIAVLAHIDDYTSVEHTLNKISKLLSREFKLFLDAGFQATLAGGSTESYSVQQREALQATLAALNIKVTCLPLTDTLRERPQLSFDSSTGQILLEEEERLNCHLEYLQQREYGQFNDLLDATYAGFPGDKIPFFKARRATRLEAQLPTFKWVCTAHAQQLEKQGLLCTPIQACRKVAEPLIKKLNKLECMVSTFKDAPALKKALQEKNFNLMLRQTSTSSKYAKIFKFLTEHRIAFKIDIASRGATSGTALEIAKKCSNDLAIELLQNFKTA